MLMNQKGQEYSVFKLLISAIVAVIILSLLLAVLGVLEIPGSGSDPAKAAEDVLNDADSKTYLQIVSPEIEFSKENSISSRALADKLSFDKEQICLSVLDGLDSKGFTVNASKSLISYSGDSKTRVKLAGICGPKETFISDGLVEDAPILEEKGFSFSSECGDVCIDGQKCCVLALIKSNG